MDSSTFSHTLAAGSSGSGQRLPGPIGEYLRLDRNDIDGADQLCVDGAAGLNLGAKSFSVDLWVRQEMYLGMYDVALYKGAKNAGTPGFDFELGQGQWDAYVRDDVEPDNRLILVSDGSTVVNQWTHLALVVDQEARQVRSYFNGSQVESEAIMATSVSSSEPFCLGDTTQPMVGGIDEVRVHGVARPQVWFLASYANVATRNAFMTIGPER
jgi:hypothetical protein